MSTYNIYIYYVYLKFHVMNSHATILSKVVTGFTIAVIIGNRSFCHQNLFEFPRVLQNIPPMFPSKLRYSPFGISVEQ